MDLTTAEVQQFKELYQTLLAEKGHLNTLVQIYFGDVRAVYQGLIRLAFDGTGLDVVEGDKTVSLFEKHGFPNDKLLFAGIVNGKNIWENNYQRTLELLEKIQIFDEVVLNASGSLMHVPFTLANEVNLDEGTAKHFSFSVEKAAETKASLKNLVLGAKKVQGGV